MIYSDVYVNGEKYTTNRVGAFSLPGKWGKETNLVFLYTKDNVTYSVSRSVIFGSVDTLAVDFRSK